MQKKSQTVYLLLTASSLTHVFIHTSIPGRPSLKRNHEKICFNFLEAIILTHHPSNVQKDESDWIMSFRRGADIVRS